jgi:2,4-dienoyl-CoA reductase-like NADH-dependent reductase (Old Yellow Enzyme family)
LLQLLLIKSITADAIAARFMLEVLEAVAAAVGEDRVGVRLCPYNIYMDATDSVEAAVEKNVWLMQQLSTRLPGLAYVHMVRHIVCYSPCLGLNVWWSNSVQAKTRHAWQYRARTPVMIVTIM